MQIRKTISCISFPHWMRQYRTTLLIATCIVMSQFFVFKLLYPFPNFLPDSYSYIEAAEKKWNINIWPIGYSWFLRLFSYFTHSHTGLVWFQYGLLQSTILYLLYSVSHLLKPGKWLFRIMLFAAICNPLTYQVSNLVSADALFATLSLVWFNQVLWIIHKPTLKLLLLHALVLLLVFTIRYNALYYPFISAALILFTKMSKWKRKTGIAAICLLLGGFIGYTQYYYRKQTGPIQFSPFGGWQLASNALYAYAKVPPHKRVQPGYKVKELQEITDKHMDSIQRLKYRPDMMLGVYYLWNEHSPLKQNMYRVWLKDSTTKDFKRWAFMGRRYKDYGAWLIKTYPVAFMKYYLWPNIINYYVPMPEFLSTYNMGQDTLAKIGVDWFRLKSNKVFIYGSPAIMLMNTYISIALALVNLLFMLSYIGFMWLEISRSYAKRPYNWIWGIWIVNMGFSVLASPIVLRYQLFPMLITQTLMIWLLIWIIKATRLTKMQSISETDSMFAKALVERRETENITKRQ